MKDWAVQVTDVVSAFAFWDTTWNSYINCYAVRTENGVVMIDGGKEEDIDRLCTALKQVNIRPEEVTTFIATHHHADHVGGHSLFPHAKKWIHKADHPLLKEELQPHFEALLPDAGIVLEDFVCQLLGHHTPGSVMLYHRPSRVLFAADHVCFFGVPLPEEGLVADAPDLRRSWSDLLTGMNQEEREEFRFDLFQQGNEKLEPFKADYLCTGHGAVLQGGVRAFFRELIAIE